MRIGRGRRRGAHRRRTAATAAFVGGMVAGLIVWSMQMHRCRRDLFSPSAMRRLAALGYLGGHPGVESARLLTEYVRWEKQAALRSRADRLLSRMQRHLM